MTVAAAFWLLGLACLIAAMAPSNIEVGSIRLPSFKTPATRLGISLIGVLALALGGVVFATDRGGSTEGPVNAAGATAGRNSTGRTDPGRTDPGRTGTDSGVAVTPSIGVVPSDDATPVTVLWHGTITMRATDAVDVSALPIKVENFLHQLRSSIYAYNGKLNTGGDNALAGWPGADQPTAQQCANELRTHPTNSVSPRAGVGLCTAGVSDVARVAFGRILSYNQSTLIAEIDLTVWSLNL